MESVTFDQLAGLALVIAAVTPALAFVLGTYLVVALRRDDHTGEPS